MIFSRSFLFFWFLKTRGPSLERLSDPFFLRIFFPKIFTISFSPVVLGRTTYLAILSQSNVLQPSSLNILRTVVLPEAIPPVKPRFIFFSIDSYKKLVFPPTYFFLEE